MAGRFPTMPPAPFPQRAAPATLRARPPPSPPRRLARSRSGSAASTGTVVALAADGGGRASASPSASPPPSARATEVCIDDRHLDSDDLACAECPASAPAAVVAAAGAPEDGDVVDLIR